MSPNEWECMQERGMEVGEIIKRPPEHTHTHTPLQCQCLSIHYIIQWSYSGMKTPHWDWPVMTQYSSLLYFSKLSFFASFSFFFFLHVTFNTALPLHMEASSKLVIAGYVEVKSLIRAMCSEHYVYIFHVSPRGNQSLQWPTRVLSKVREHIYELTVHSHGMNTWRAACICSCTKSIVHQDVALKCRGNTLN